jgi:hypothetical protein
MFGFNDLSFQRKRFLSEEDQSRPFLPIDTAFVLEKLFLSKSGCGLFNIQY